MSSLESMALRYDGEKNRLWILDQVRLPLYEEWVESKSLEDMYTIIQNLQVRGAPLIGVAAGLALAQWVRSCPKASLEEIASRAAYLRKARPTAVNLMNVLDAQVKAMREQNSANAVIDLAYKFFHDDKEYCLSMAKHGLPLIPQNARILTHCNTGSLVTTGLGTALGVVKYAQEKGRNVFVHVDETRPLLQGARLTAYELAKAGIPYKLNCDNMAAYLMAKKQVDLVILGADRIAANGDFANKIGTYSLAVLCHYHGIPFYVAAPETTIDPKCPSGEFIEVEERKAEEVSSYGGIKWSLALPHQVTNPAFDVTPHQLVTRYILNSGLYRAEDLKRLF